jgi:hypothetical protein
MSFRIRGEGRQFLSQLIEDRKSKVSGLTPHYSYYRRKPKRQFGTHTRDNAWHARRLGFFATQTMQCPTQCEWGTEPGRQQCQSTPCGEVARKVGHHAHDLKEKCVAFDS